MILVTVGTQLPFDRLIKMVDEMAPRLDRKIIAQAGTSGYGPVHIDMVGQIPAPQFDDLLKQASVMIAHAGIGTVLKAYKHRKPIILVPRRSALGEHRNDHQLATAAQLRGRPGIYVTETPEELYNLLNSQLEPAIMVEKLFQGRKRLQDFVSSKVAEALAQ